MSKRHPVVDKTELIRDLMSSKIRSHVVHVPTGFGKTTNLNMIEDFLSKKSKVEFKNTKIWKDVGFVEKHFRKYTVVRVSLGNCFCDSWEVWLDQVCKAFGWVGEIPIIDDRVAYRLTDRIKPRDNNTVLLLDDYDTALYVPFEDSMQRDIQAHIFRELFGCLCNELGFVKILAMGTIFYYPIWPLNCAHYDAFEGSLGRHYGFSRSELEDIFGCTETEGITPWDECLPSVLLKRSVLYEIEAMLGLLDGIQKWYGGYTYRNLVCPRSLILFLASGMEFKTYWSNCLLEGGVFMGKDNGLWQPSIAEISLNLLLRQRSEYLESGEDQMPKIEREYLNLMEVDATHDKVMMDLCRLGICRISDETRHVTFANLETMEYAKKLLHQLN